MLKKLRQKIENKRGSKKLFDKFLVFAKDISWTIFNLSRALNIRIINILNINFLNLKKFLDATKLKFYINKIKILFRILLGKGKMPDFLIIGADKCGTTYLWQTLKNHPDIEMAPHFLRAYKLGKRLVSTNKEVKFFEKPKISKIDLAYYKSLFNNNEKLQGEASPIYIVANICHENMEKFVPNAKLILLLRNPTYRAFSAFNHMLREKSGTWGYGKGYNPNKNFYENIKEDIKLNFGCGQLLTNGFYITKIKNLLKHYPQRQLLILITEQIDKKPQEAYQKICNFLGVKNIPINLTKRANVGGYIQKMDEESKKILEELYQPYNEELYQFLGYTIEEWKDQKQVH